MINEIYVFNFTLIEVILFYLFSLLFLKQTIEQR